MKVVATEAAVTAKADEVPEIRARPQPTGYDKQEYTVDLSDPIKPEHLEEPQCWALAKHLSAQDNGPCLMPGDRVLCVHKDYFADVIVDMSGPGEQCYTIVRAITPRKKRDARARVLVPGDHYVELNPKSGRYDYGFMRGADSERVPMGDTRTYDQAAEECRKHADRVAPR